MRNDLTEAFLVEMDKNENTPIQLLVFHFSSGEIYLSDREISLGGNTYKGIVEDFGELSTVSAENAISSTMSMTVTIWNGDSIPFSNKFLSEDPVDIFVDVYQTYEGLAAEDIAHIGEFVIQDPIEYKEASSLLELDLVTTNMRYFGNVGTVLTREDYPNALEADLNKSIDLIIGDAGDVKCLCSNKPPSATLSGSILKRPTKIYTHENLNDLNFTQFGFIQIDEEKMRYLSRGDYYFNVSHRAQYKTIASDHSDGQEIIQASDFNGIYPAVVEYIVGQGPLDSTNGITNVKVKGQTPSISYSVLPNQNPAIIRFSEQPTYVEYSKGARSTEEFFDNVNADNTAIKPEWAYDQENKSLGAIIKKATNTKLSVIQNDQLMDDGQIVKLFLFVEHWETKAYKNDSIGIFVDGVNNGLKIGTLNRPNEKDIINIGGEIDLTHGHDHITGDDHDHHNIDPAFDVSTGFHEHGLSLEDTLIVDPPTQLYYFPIDGYLSSYVDTTPNVASATRMRVVWQVWDWGAGFSLDYDASASISIGGVTAYNGDFNQRISFPEHFQGRGFYIKGFKDTTYARTVVVKIIEVSVVTNISTTDPEIQAVSMDKQATGSVGNVSTNLSKIKDSADVVDLPAGYTSELVNILQENSSRSVVQRFDVTKYLENISWDWTKGRKVWLQYSGTADDVEVIITNIGFEIEYRQRQVRTTDDVTCTAMGSIESRPDAVVQYLLTEKAGLPESKLGSVNRNVPILYDDHIMWDYEIWIDEGQVAGVPDGALFEEAGSWYALRDYSIDGVLSGNSTIKDAIQKINLQTHSKLTWQNGFAKLSVMRKNDDWLIAKDIPLNDIQLMSYEVKRSESYRINNLINLFYAIDRLSEATGSEQYSATSVVRDNQSIIKHGIRTDGDNWLFDLVRNQAMADYIADYYIWLLGETQTYYSLSTYLNNFDIEKEDFITISSYKIDQLNKLPVAVKELVRVFGSGKLSRINLLKLICQSIRHRFYQEEKTENVLISETITASLDLDAEVQELAEIEEYIDTVFGITDSEELSLDETYSTEFVYDQRTTESPTVDESISFDMEVLLSDELSVADDMDGYLEIPFGGGGFGFIPFGSVAVFKEVPTDQLPVSETIKVDMGSTETEEFSIAEDLVTSDGFGGVSVLSSGFGVTPFGY